MFLWPVMGGMTATGPPLHHISQAFITSWSVMLSPAALLVVAMVAMVAMVIPPTFSTTTTTYWPGRWDRF